MRKGYFCLPLKYGDRYGRNCSNGIVLRGGDGCSSGQDITSSLRHASRRITKELGLGGGPAFVAKDSVRASG